MSANFEFENCFLFMNFCRSTLSLLSFNVPALMFSPTNGAPPFCLHGILKIIQVIINKTCICYLLGLNVRTNQEIDKTIS